MTYTQVVDTMTGKVNANIVENTATGSFVPNDPDNADWRVFAAWVKAGNTPDQGLASDMLDWKAIVADTPDPVPQPT